MTWILGAMVVAVAIAILMLGRLLTRERARLFLTFHPDELHWARTSDGWLLPVGRYLPRGQRVVAEPVILCHGMGANRFNLDLNARYSLARYLAARGFECFVVELRGSGMSRRETPGRRYGFDFDDIVRGDIPALIACAREVSGAERVLWVGHSKGGIVMYAWCATGIRSELAGVVAIGSPAAFPHFTGVRKALLSRGGLYRLVDAIYVERITRALAPLGKTGWIRLTVMARHENMDPEVTALAMANLLGNISTGVTQAFARWISTGTFKSLDEKDDYRAGLASSPVPFLLIAGSRDVLVPPPAVEAAREAMVQARAQGRVEYLLAGKSTGFASDYGHGDLVLGRRAPEEIFPRIEAWLKAQGTVIG